MSSKQEVNNAPFTTNSSDERNNTTTKTSPTHGKKPENLKKHSPSLILLNSVLGKLVLVQFENFPVYLD